MVKTIFETALASIWLARTNRKVMPGLDAIGALLSDTR